MKNKKIYNSGKLEIFITYFNNGLMLGFSCYKNISYKPYFYISINLIVFNIEIYKSK